MLLNFVQAHLDLSQADALKCYVPILLYSFNSHTAFCVCTLRFKICKIIKYCGTPTPVLGGLIYSLLHLAWRCCMVSPPVRILKAGMCTRGGAVRQLIGGQFTTTHNRWIPSSKAELKKNQQVSSLISVHWRSLCQPNPVFLFFKYPIFVIWIKSGLNWSGWWYIHSLMNREKFEFFA